MIPADATNALIREICARHGVLEREFLLPGRGRSNAKQAAALAEICKALRTRGWSFCQIGNKLNKDHSTIMHHCRNKNVDKL